jgi:hypothetical protein
MSLFAIVPRDPIDIEFFVEGIENVAPDRDYDEGVDIYSVGMTVLEMVTTSCFHGKRPYRECNRDRAEIIRRKIEGILPEDVYAVANDNLRDFIMKCLTFETEGGKRPTILTLLETPFMTGDESDSDIVSCNPIDNPDIVYEAHPLARLVKGVVISDEDSRRGRQGSPSISYTLATDTKLPGDFSLGSTPLGSPVSVPPPVIPLSFKERVRIYPLSFFPFFCTHDLLFPVVE